MITTIETPLVLDLAANNTYNRVYGMQLDNNTRKLIISLENNGEPYTIPSDVTVKLQGHRPDNAPIFKDCEVIHNQIHCILTSYELAVPGDCHLTITLYEGNPDIIQGFSGNRLSTFQFKVVVPENPLNEKVIVGTKEFSVLTEAILKAERALDNAGKALEKAEDLCKNADKRFVLKSEVGKADGIPSLDEDGKIPLEQLPDNIGDNTGSGDGYKLSDNNFSDYYRKKLDSIEENANYFDSSSLSNAYLSIFKQDPLHKTLTEAEINSLKDKYTKTEIDNLISSISTGLSWKEPVDSFTDLPLLHPEPSNGDTVNVTNDPDAKKNGTYVYDKSTDKWVQISSSTTPKATADTDGLLSKEDKAVLDSIKEFVDNYEEPKVTEETITSLEKNLDKKFDDCIKKDTIIKEENIDPTLIKKLSTSDGSLVNDNETDAGSVWSSSKTAGAINDAVNDAVNNEVTADDLSAWFSEIDADFSKYL